MLTADEYSYFAGRALDGMTAIVAGLGDDLANRRPAGARPCSTSTGTSRSITARWS